MSNMNILTRRLVLLIGFLMITLLTGCGGGGDADPVEGPSSSSLLQQQLSELEASGGIPLLDRSRDILGPDQNRSGIRDDIEAYIATLTINESQRRAALQMARALQASLAVDLSNEEALRTTSRKLSDAGQCLSIRFPDPNEMAAMVTRLEAITANTKERTQRYIGFNTALSGSVSRLPSGDTCDAL